MSYENLSSKVPIPSYLFAIAAGDFKYQSLTDNIGFYADNNQSLEKALKSLKESSKYFLELKNILGESPWAKQDFLLVPNITNIVGMENPMLIYISEEVLDNGANYIAAHELAHMWTGNIVTQKGWDDLWINEAWSTYFEDRLLEAIHGKRYSDINASKTYQDLIDAERERLSKPYDNSQLTRMHKTNTENIHPRKLIDFSVYPKGSSMLRHIEKIIGRENFDIFARNYLSDFKYIPVDSDMFIEYASKKLIEINPKINWNSYFRDWIFNAGMKPNVRVYNLPEVPIPATY